MNKLEVKTINQADAFNQGLEDGAVEEGFSILIPSWNNLPFLMLCVESIKQHSAFNHQIIIHVNEGTDGTLEWVEKEGLDYTYSKSNIGVCLAMNTMRRKVMRNYIYFINDDMYVLPGWDVVLMNEIRSLPDNMFFLSSTMIQPHNKNDVGLCINYGDGIDTFQRDRLLRDYMNEPYPDWMGATRPPNIVHRDIWDLVGGYSVEFSPGMYSDPDFTAKLLMAGVRYLKGLGKSRVYHFETKTTERIHKNDGVVQFLLKWGILNSTMRKYITCQGENFGDNIPIDEKRLNAKTRFVKMKAIWYLLVRGFGPYIPFWKTF